MRLVHATMLESGKIYVSSFEKMKLEDKVWKSNSSFFVLKNVGGFITWSKLDVALPKSTYFTGKYYEFTPEEIEQAKMHFL